MRVGERPPAGDDFLQQVDGAVVVLELEALARLGHEVLRTDVHGPPRTIVRSAGSPPRCRPWAGSRARVPRVAGRRPSAARPPAGRRAARCARLAPPPVRSARSARPPARERPVHSIAERTPATQSVI